MEFYPSEIARLVLGYLKEKDCLKSYQTFLEESTDLDEYFRLCKQGLIYPTNVRGKSLLDILEIYCEIEKSSQNYNSRTNASQQVSSHSRTSSNRNVTSPSSNNPLVSVVQICGGTGQHLINKNHQNAVDKSIQTEQVSPAHGNISGTEPNKNSGQNTESVPPSSKADRERHISTNTIQLLDSGPVQGQNTETKESFDSDHSSGLQFPSYSTPVKDKQNDAEVISPSSRRLTPSQRKFLQSIRLQETPFKLDTSSSEVLEEVKNSPVYRQIISLLSADTNTIDKNTSRVDNIVISENIINTDDSLNQISANTGHREISGSQEILGSNSTYSISNNNSHSKELLIDQGTSKSKNIDSELNKQSKMCVSASNFQAVSNNVADNSAQIGANKILLSDDITNVSEEIPSVVGHVHSNIGDKAGTTCGVKTTKNDPKITSPSKQSICEIDQNIPHDTNQKSISHTENLRNNAVNSQPELPLLINYNSVFVNNHPEAHLPTNENSRNDTDAVNSHPESQLPVDLNSDSQTENSRSDAANVNDHPEPQLPTNENSKNNTNIVNSHHPESQLPVDRNSDSHTVDSRKDAANVNNHPELQLPSIENSSNNTDVVNSHPESQLPVDRNSDSHTVNSRNDAANVNNHPELQLPSIENSSNNTDFVNSHPESQLPVGQNSDSHTVDSRNDAANVNNHPELQLPSIENSSNNTDVVNSHPESQLPVNQNSDLQTENSRSDAANVNNYLEPHLLINQNSVTQNENLGDDIDVANFHFEQHPPVTQIVNEPILKFPTVAVLNVTSESGTQSVQYQFIRYNPVNTSIALSGSIANEMIVPLPSAPVASSTSNQDQVAIAPGPPPAVLNPRSVTNMIHSENAVHPVTASKRKRVYEKNKSTQRRKVEKRGGKKNAEKKSPKLSTVNSHFPKQLSKRKRHSSSPEKSEKIPEMNLSSDIPVLSISESPASGMLSRITNQFEEEHKSSVLKLVSGEALERIPAATSPRRSRRIKASKGESQKSAPFYESPEKEFQSKQEENIKNDPEYLPKRRGRPPKKKAKAIASHQPNFDMTSAILESMEEARQLAICTNNTNLKQNDKKAVNSIKTSSSENTNIIQDNIKVIVNNGEYIMQNSSDDVNIVKETLDHDCQPCTSSSLNSAALNNTNINITKEFSETNLHSVVSCNLKEASLQSSSPKQLRNSAILPEKVTVSNYRKGLFSHGVKRNISEVNNKAKSQNISAFINAEKLEKKKLSELLSEQRAELENNEHKSKFSRKDKTSKDSVTNNSRNSFNTASKSSHLINSQLSSDIDKSNKLLDPAGKPITDSTVISSFASCNMNASDKTSVFMQNCKQSSSYKNLPNLNRTNTSNECNKLVCQAKSRACKPINFCTSKSSLSSLFDQTASVRQTKDPRRKKLNTVVNKNETIISSNLSTASDPADILCTDKYYLHRKRSLSLGESKNKAASISHETNKRNKNSTDEKNMLACNIDSEMSESTESNNHLVSTFESSVGVQETQNACRHQEDLRIAEDIDNNCGIERKLSESSSDLQIVLDESINSSPIIVKKRARITSSSSSNLTPSSSPNKDLHVSPSTNSSPLIVKGQAPAITTLSSSSNLTPCSSPNKDLHVSPSTNSSPLIVKGQAPAITTPSSSSNLTPCSSPIKDLYVLPEENVQSAVFYSTAVNIKEGDDVTDSMSPQEDAQSSAFHSSAVNIKEREDVTDSISPVENAQSAVCHTSHTHGGVTDNDVIEISNSNIKDLQASPIRCVSKMKKVIHKSALSKKIEEDPNIPAGVKIPSKWNNSKIINYSHAIQESVRIGGKTKEKVKPTKLKERQKMASNGETFKSIKIKLNDGQQNTRQKTFPDIQDGSPHKNTVCDQVFSDIKLNKVPCVKLVKLPLGSTTYRIHMRPDPDAKERANPTQPNEFLETINEKAPEEKGSEHEILDVNSKLPPNAVTVDYENTQNMVESDIGGSSDKEIELAIAESSDKKSELAIAGSSDKESELAIAIASCEKEMLNSSSAHYSQSSEKSPGNIQDANNDQMLLDSMIEESERMQLILNKIKEYGLDYVFNRLKDE